MGLVEVGRYLGPDMRNVVIKGDSDLVVGFMTRRFKPKKKDLALLVKAAWDIIKSWKSVRARFYHVPREFNQVADWLSKLAREVKCHFTLADLSPLFSDD